MKKLTIDDFIEKIEDDSIGLAFVSKAVITGDDFEDISAEFIYDFMYLFTEFDGFFTNERVLEAIKKAKKCIH